MPTTPVVPQDDMHKAAIAELEQENKQRKLEMEELRNTVRSCEEKLRQLMYSLARAKGPAVTTDVTHSLSNNPRLWKNG